MAKQASSDEARQKHSSHVPWWAWFLTAVWAFAVLALVSQTQVCDTAEVDDGFLIQHLSCLRASELGDLLAGAFAPLAFLWFLVAIFVQLAELRLGREEFSTARKAMQDQTIVSMQQLDKEKGKEKTAEFEALVQALAKEFREGQGSIVGYNAHGLRPPIQRLTISRKMLENVDGNFLSLLVPGLEGHNKTAGNVLQITDVKLCLSDPTRFQNVLKISENLFDMKDDLPPGAQTDFATFRIANLHRSLKSFAAKFGDQIDSA